MPSTRQNRRNSIEQNNRIVQENARSHMNRRTSRVTLIIVYLYFISMGLAAIIVRGLESDKDCDLVEYINAWTGLFLVGGTLSLIFDTYKFFRYIRSDIPHPKKIKTITKITHLFTYGLFGYSIWILVETDSCQNDMSHMYNVILSYTIITGIFISLPLLIGCLLLCSLPCLLMMSENLDRTEGVDDKFLDKSPKSVFQDGKIVEKEDEFEIGEEDAACCICVTDYENGGALRRLQCGHHFHQECVDKWLKINRTCPLCRDRVDSTVNV